jgi:transposase-like protein
VTCHNCRIEAAKFGKHRNGRQRYRCVKCRKTFTQAHERTFGDMYTSDKKGLLALQLLLEGNSIRSVERVTELHRDTVLRLLVLAGERCEKLMGRLIVNVPVKDAADR